MRFYRYFIIFFLFLQTVENLNILGVFPHHGYSHFKVFHPLVLRLAEKGHNVTIITYIRNEEPHENYKEMLLTGMPTVNIAEINDFEPRRSLRILYDEFISLADEGFESCKLLYESGFPATVVENHKQQPYDLMITESFNTDCHLAIAEILNLPVVGISSCALMPWFYDRISLPDFPAFVQSEFIGFPEVLNWHERLVNFVQFKLGKILYRYTNYRDAQLIKKYFGLDIDVHEAAKRLTKLILVNQHFSFSGSRPLSTQYIEVGGLHLSRSFKHTLPNEIEDFLNKSQKGVLLISWGSVLRSSTLEQEKLQAIVKALLDIEMDVIWKWEEARKPIDNEKFLFSKWVQQAALLAHPKVKLFWSHGGLLGTTEAVYFGKPLIVTPFYGDQFLNAYAVLNRNIGRVLYYDDINLMNLKKVLKEISQANCEQNVKAISRIFNDRPLNALDTAVWWIEFIAKQGNRSDLLKSPGLNLNWVVYHSLDSLVILIGAFLTLVFIIYYPIQIYKNIKRNKTLKTKKMKKK